LIGQIAIAAIGDVEEPEGEDIDDKHCDKIIDEKVRVQGLIGCNWPSRYTYYELKLFISKQQKDDFFVLMFDAFLRHSHTRAFI
jgi:hypothetical protein